MISDNTLLRRAVAIIASVVFLFCVYYAWRSHERTAGKLHLGSPPADGTFIWGFYLQGVQLTPTQIDNYLNSTGGKNPCALITDYGVAGGITANALKFLSAQRGHGYFRRR